MVSRLLERPVMENWPFLLIVLQALFAKAKIKGKKVEKKDVKKPGGAPPDEVAAEP